MNLREETLAALRPFVALIEAIECTTDHAIGDDSNWDINAPAEFSIVSIGDLRAARRLYHSLSRLEAGSGEETGWQPIETAPKDGTHFIGWSSVHGAVETNFEYTDPDTDWDVWMSVEQYDWSPTHWMPLPPPPLNQEGGDPHSRQPAAHVATPAPGENSERADEPPDLDALLEAAAADHEELLTRPPGKRPRETANLISNLSLAIEVLRLRLARAYDAGRRSMREEAAKKADEFCLRETEDVAAAIRAIPEKPASPEVDPNAWAFKHGLEST